MRTRLSSKKIDTEDKDTPSLVFETNLPKRIRETRDPKRPRVSKFALFKTNFLKTLQNPKKLFQKSSIKREKKIIPSSAYFILLVGVFIGFFFVIYNSYKVSRFEINKLQIIDVETVTSDLKIYIRGKSFFKVSPGDLEKYLKERHPLIDKVYVDKSFVRGLLIDVKEYIPVAVLRMDDLKYFVTKEGTLIDYYETSKSFYTLNFEGTKEDIELVLPALEKATFFLREFDKLNMPSNYTFDNFGNLSILTLDNRLIKIDLREDYHSIDEQLKVLQNAIIKEDFAELNFRSNKLIVKYKN